jgi:tetratricopeptide (TPR) repeat protein
MGAIINLVDRLLARGRTLAAFGRRSEARHTLERLLSIPDLAPAARAEAHLLLAELSINAQHYRKARRHLAVVLALQPDNAEVYYRMAVGMDLDPTADPRRAWKLVRKALAMQPHKPAYWSAFGQLALRLRKRRTALNAFRKAAELAPAEVSVLDEIVDGLMVLSRQREALRVLRAARFRMRNDAGLERLWGRFRFICLARQQKAERLGLTGRDGEPSLLPFVSSSDSARKGFGSGIIRDDRFSKSSSHVRLSEAVRSDPRHAP